MNDFENKIINLSSLNASAPDPAVFLTRFRGQQEKEMIQKKRVVSCINAFAFIFFIAIFTVSQFKDNPTQDIYWNEMANDLEYYETELMIFFSPRTIFPLYGIVLPNDFLTSSIVGPISSR